MAFDESKTLRSRDCVQPTATAGAPDCLSAESAIAFAAGKLTAAERADALVHLDACHTCQHVISEAMHALDAAAGSQPADSQPTTAPMAPPSQRTWGTTFRADAMISNRYRVIEFIARGGMGEVYAVEDTTLGERVALKTVASTLSDEPGAVEQLKAEVQLARRVAHSNVCRTFDLGVHHPPELNEPVRYLSMEYIDGVSLGQHLRANGPLELDMVQRLSTGLLAGLRAAHEAGVLHRDFKSDNVMLRAGVHGVRQPVIMDFGLASAFSKDESRLNQANRAIVGSLAYMAPEQLDGRPLRVTTDLYSFGVVLFEMLTGHLPFEGNSPAMNAIRRLTEAPKTPSDLNPLVPESFDAIVARCLAKNPQERYASALEVEQALAQAGGSPAPRAMPLPERHHSQAPDSVDSLVWGRPPTSGRLKKGSWLPLLFAGLLATTALALWAFWPSSDKAIASGNPAPTAPSARLAQTAQSLRPAPKPPPASAAGTLAEPAGPVSSITPVPSARPVQASEKPAVSVVVAGQHRASQDVSAGSQTLPAQQKRASKPRAAQPSAGGSSRVGKLREVGAADKLAGATRNGPATKRAVGRAHKLAVKARDARASKRENARATPKKAEAPPAASRAAGAPAKRCGAGLLCPKDFAKPNTAQPK